MSTPRRYPVGAELSPDGGVHVRVWAPVRKRVAGKEYDDITSAQKFAQKLTEDLREVCHDKHLGVSYPTARLRDHALAMKRGGVGYYKASDFVHVDTGRVRFW